MIFDGIYDGVIKPFVEDPKKFVNNTVNRVSETLDDVGDAVSGFFQNLGSIFNVNMKVSISEFANEIY